MSNERLEWINKRAYEIWEEHGRPEGHDQANWEQANREFEAMEAAAIATPPSVVIAEEQAAAPTPVVKPKAAPKKAAAAKDPGAKEPGAVVRKPRAKPAAPKT